MQADWHPEDIKAALRKKGWTITRLARHTAINKQNISLALSCRSSRRVEQIIAEAIGIEPQKIWPSRYDERGKRIMLRALSAREQAAA